MKDVLVLDKWDSQLVWIAKGWVTEKIGDNYFVIDKLKCAKQVWSERCAVNFESVKVIYIIERIVKILNELDDNLALKLISRLAPSNPYLRSELLYTDNEGYIENAFDQLMMLLSVIQIKDGDREIVKLEPLDMSIFKD